MTFLIKSHTKSQSLPGDTTKGEAREMARMIAFGEEVEIRLFDSDEHIYTYMIQEDDTVLETKVGPPKPHAPKMFALKQYIMLISLTGALALILGFIFGWTLAEVAVSRWVGR